MRVRRFGKTYAHPLLVLVTLPNEIQSTRIAVSAGRSVGNAVHRNRAKRLIRAALHLLVSVLPPGWDIILIARRPLAMATFSQTQNALLLLLQRAGLIESVHAS